VTAHTPTQIDELEALRRLVEGTATETGEGFFKALVENLSAALDTMGAWIATLEPDSGTLSAISMKLREQWFVDFRYRIEGTPCQVAFVERRLVHVPDRVVESFSHPYLRQHGAVSYLGVPLFDLDGRIIGQLAVLDDKPMPEHPRHLAMFRVFADRAAAELRRLERERALREREGQLRRLLECAMDAIVNLDEGLCISLANPAAARMFECSAEGANGRDFREFLAPESGKVLLQCTEELARRDEANASSWIAGGLRAETARGRDFHAEATLSRYSTGQGHRFTLILRDVEERLAAERRIDALLSETESLREELRSINAFEPILGESSALVSTLREIESVAKTDTTVVLLGETGTGKELFARALHAQSNRSARPLVKLNCGAIPANLIESELFGHERGAFTGATSRRQGRFSLADGGTLFLDEIGELPVDLQPKLLRVLQEGEFEPVGSSRTSKVDVRVVAATNRNLAERVKSGAFREDLYYRLNVFPIRIPPLRERGDDVAILAKAFLERFCRRTGRSLAPLSETALARLASYDWPGNVRELENVMERGVIISKSGVFDVDRALSDVSRTASRPAPAPNDARILTSTEMEQLERSNILRALDAAAWKVSGASGAAALLGLNPSTLASRMRALDIRRPVRS
jgi:PAS domain S-box-containing protein